MRLNKKKIILFYEIIHRELDSCKNIKKCLEEQYGYKVYLFSIFWDYLKAVRTAKKNKIEAIIMPWMYSERDYKLLMPFLKLNNKLRVVNLCNEQIASDETLSITLCRGDLVKQNVVHLCWGQYFKNLLEKYGVPSENAIVSGNARLDGVFNCNYSRSELAEKFGLDINKKWILFAESRDWVLFKENLNARIALGLPEELEKRSYIAHKNSLFKTYEDLDGLNHEFFNKYELIYRPHPASPSPEMLNPKVKLNSQLTIYDWLGNVDYYITSTSTSIFEADAKGLPVIVVEPLNWPEEFKTYGLDEYYKINSLHEFDEECVIKAIQKIKDKNVFEKYIGKCDGENYKRISKIVHDIIGTNTKPMQFIDVELNELKFKNRVKMRIAKLLIKCKMHNLLPDHSIFKLLQHDAPFIKKNKKLLND